MTGSATYLYAITRPIPVEALDGQRGVGGTAVRVIEHGEIACLVSSVDLREFGQEPLTAHLEDVAWLGRTAREHDQVVRAAAQLTATVPLRMATVCLDDDAVHARLDKVNGSALAALREVDGRDEWGVKLFAITPAPDVEEVPAEPSSGTAYLLQRRRERDRRTTGLEQAGRDAAAVFERLADAAVASCQHRPQDARLSGVPHPMLLNAAFLVDRADEEAFRAVVAELSADRPPESLVLTGPWPPYSFVPSEAT